MFKIEKDVKPPVRKITTRKTSPVSETMSHMEPGDSFFVPAKHDTREPFTIRSLVSINAKRKGWVCTVRLVIADGVEGVRVWRVR